MRRPSDTTAVHGLFVGFGLVIAAFFPFIALFLKDRGLSASEIGAVLALTAFARVVSNPIWGHLADTTLGRRTALQLGAFGAAVAAGFLGLAHGFVPITLAGAALAGFMVSTGSNIDAVALEHLGDDRMSDYGRIRGWESLSYAVACLGLGILFEVFGVRWEMAAYVVASTGVAVWSFTLVRDHPRRLDEPGRLGTVGAVFREAPRLWGFLVAAFLLWTGFNAAWNFVGITIEARGGGPLLVGLGTALGGLVEVGVMRGSSRWQRRFGLRAVYVAGCVVYAVTFELWGAVRSPTLLSLLTVFEGMAFSLLFTTGVVIVGRLVPRHLYSTGISLVQTVGFGLGPILGAGLGGIVYQHAGPLVLFSGASVLALAGAGVAFFALDTPGLAGPPPRDETAVGGVTDAVVR